MQHIASHERSRVTKKTNAPKKWIQNAPSTNTKFKQPNLSFIVAGDITESDKRILFTQWLGEAWAQMCLKTDTIIGAFQRCGIFNAIDNSEDWKIDIKGYEDDVIVEDYE